MTLKKYHQLRIITTIVIAIIFSQSLVLKNFFVPVITIMFSWLVLNHLRHQVKEVIADERDYQVSGQSAFLAIQLYSWIATIVMFILYVLRDTNPSFEPVAATLAYSTCFLMFGYSLIIKFHDRLLQAKNKIGLYVFITLIAIGTTIFTLRFFSGEDDWVCQNGQWVKHGQPSFPAPTTICK